MNKLCSLANNIQIVQGILRNSPASCCRSCPRGESRVTYLGRSLRGRKGLHPEEPPGRGRGEGRSPAKREGPAGRREEGEGEEPAAPPLRAAQAEFVLIPGPGSVAPGRLRPPGRAVCGRRAAPAPGGGQAHGAGTHSAGDRHPALFLRHLVHAVPLRPWGPTAILRQGPLSPGSRAGQVPTGPCHRRALYLPARGPQGRWAPRGGTRGLRAEKGTSPPSRPPRGPWTRGCHRASCAGGAPEVGERGRGTSSGEGRQCPRGLAHPAPLPLSSRTGRLSLPPLPRASCPRGAPLPTAPASRPSGCPALPCAGTGGGGGRCVRGVPGARRSHESSRRPLPKSEMQTRTTSFL